MIEKLEKKHSADITKIHIQALSSGFLPSLGFDFLKTFYDGVINKKNNFGFVEVQRNRVVGFVLGTEDMDSFMKNAIKEKFFKLAYLLLIQIIKKPLIIKNILETLLYSGKESGPKAELVIIAVDKRNKRKGIGRKLVFILEEEMKKRKIPEYKVGVTKRNKNANRFYIGMGFKKLTSFSLYGKVWNLYTKGYKEETPTKEIMKKLLMESPFSWALIRTIECELLKDIDLKKPVLDAGCGTGFFAEVVLKVKGKKEFETGLDLSKKELNQARKRKVYKRLVNASVLDMPFKNGEFNTVFSNGVLEHVEEMGKALREIKRVTKKKGRLIFTVPSSYFTSMLFFSFIPGYGELLNRMFKHHNLFNHNKWQGLLKENGFKLIDYKYYNPRKQVVYHELSMFLALPSYLSKALFNRWILFPGLRKIILPLLVNLMSLTYLNKTSKTQGGSLLLVAEKI